MKKGLVITLIIVAIVLVLFGIFHRSIISSFYEHGTEGPNGGTEGSHEFENKTLWNDNISATGTGSCTTREECEAMLGKGAFCSNGKCFPAPADYNENMAECYCSDGTKIKAVDCRWIDCPNEPTSPTQFTVKNGIVTKVTVDINFPLSGKEALKVAIAACGISAETSIPNSPYENIISECSPAWSFLDESNPCNNTRAYVCGNKTFVSCIFGEENKGNTLCIEGQPIMQGEYNEKFIVANPIDLSQVEKFTKFRSCSGHDYSGYNDKGEVETQRSMKQGAIAKSEVSKMNIYAPFNGTIIKYFVSPGAEGPEEEHEAWIMGDYSGKWIITFGHFTAKEGLKIGSKVTAGELIGSSTIQAANAENDGVEIGLNQDVSTETLKEQFVRGAILDYANDQIIGQYASYGVTKENTVFTKEYRDAHPCNWNAVGVDPANFIVLSQN